MTQSPATTHRRRGATFWRRTLTEHQRSGLTQLEFCRRNELALSTFQYWRRRLRSVDVETETDVSTDFVEVAVRPVAVRARPDATDSSDGFELTFPNGLRLKVPIQVEGRALAEVLWALEATGTC